MLNPFYEYTVNRKFLFKSPLDCKKHIYGFIIIEFDIEFIIESLY